MKKFIVFLFLLLTPCCFAQNSWSPVYTFTSDLNDASFTNDSIGFVATSTNIMMTTNGGTNWSQVYNNSANSIRFLNSSLGFACTDNSTLKTTNGGINWDPIGNIRVSGINMIDTLYGYARGSFVGQSYIVKTMDGATTWFPVAAINDNSQHDNCFFNRNIGVATYSHFVKPGSSFWFSRTTNGGTNWANVSTTGMYYMQKMDSNTAYATGVNGIYKSVDKGASWQSIPVGYPSFYCNFLNINTGYVTGPPSGGFTSRIVKTTDGGQSWSISYSIQFDDFRKIVCTDSLTAYAMCTNRKLYKTTSGGLTVTNQNSNTIPDKFLLSQNFPNPFNRTTSIRYTIPVRTGRDLSVTLKVYDMNGKEIETLVNENQNAGSYSVLFNAGNYPSGVYFYKLEAGSFSETRKMVLLK